MALKTGEKVIFGIAVLFLFLGLFVGYKVYTHAIPVKAKTFYNLSELGSEGYNIFRDQGCNNCHRAMGIGEPISPEIDGEGSKRTKAWLKDYLDQPTKRINPTLHDGKFAPNFSELSAYEKAALVEFMSDLRALPGSAAYYKSPERMKKEASEDDGKGKMEHETTDPTPDAPMTDAPEPTAAPTEQAPQTPATPETTTPPAPEAQTPAIQPGDSQPSPHHGGTP